MAFFVFQDGDEMPTEKQLRAATNARKALAARRTPETRLKYIRYMEATAESVPFTDEERAELAGLLGGSDSDAP